MLLYFTVFSLLWFKRCIGGIVACNRHLPRVGYQKKYRIRRYYVKLRQRQSPKFLELTRTAAADPHTSVVKRLLCESRSKPAQAILARRRARLGQFQGLLQLGYAVMVLRV